MVMTPFHRLALAAQNSAFKSQDLKPKDVEALLKEPEGKLVPWATLRWGRSRSTSSDAMRIRLDTLTTCRSGPRVRPTAPPALSTPPRRSARLHARGAAP